VTLVQSFARIRNVSRLKLLQVLYFELASFDDEHLLFNPLDRQTLSPYNPINLLGFASISVTFGGPVKDSDLHTTIIVNLAYSKIFLCGSPEKDLDYQVCR
jgi:hypothetical protein